MANKKTLNKKQKPFIGQTVYVGKRRGKIISTNYSTQLPLLVNYGKWGVAAYTKDGRHDSYKDKVLSTTPYEIIKKGFTQI